MALVDRHIGFVEALRAAGLPVSLAEGLDAARALTHLDLGEREVLRAAYATTLVKRAAHRPNFDTVFDLFFPAVTGDASTDVEGESAERAGLAEPLRDDGPALGDFQDRLAGLLADPSLGEESRTALDQLAALAREGVGRFGRLGDRGPGRQQWSSYSTLNRVDPDALVERAVAGLLDGGIDDEPAARRGVGARVASFTRLVEQEVRRREAEERGPAYVASYATRPSIEQLDFSGARQADIAEMRRQIYPLARRLAARLTREHHARRRGPLDVRRTVRASLSTGGVPIETHRRPKRPGRTDLVVLCDVSGSVASFAQFTLLFVFALQEQFSRVRAFTFVDDVHEVTDHFRPGADVADTMVELAKSARYASLWGRTNYGRAFTRFAHGFPDALTPKTSLLVLGDARSNYSDLALDVVARMVHDTRHVWWLNPEHPRHWRTGDSAAHQYADLVPMVECRNLTQLAEFIHDIA